MRKPIVIGDKIYKYKKDVILHYRKILNSYDFGNSLNEEDFYDLIDLLEFEEENNKNFESDSSKSEPKHILPFDNTLFSNYEMSALDNDGNRYIKCPVSTTKFIDYKNVYKLSKDIQILKNERYFCVTNGDFIFGDFIEAFIVHRNFYVNELTISTLSLTQENVDSLYNLLKGGYVQNLNLIVSDHFFSYERENLVKYIYQTLDINNKFQLSVCNNKSRIVLIQTDVKGGRKYVIHGSANLSSSNSIEQFCLEENDLLFDFNKIFFDEIIEKFKTIEKSIENERSDGLQEGIILDGRATFNDFSEKEVKIIDVKVSQVQFNTKCFEIFYDDETSHYISYLMIINNTKYTPEKLFNVACRNSIHSDIKSLKQDYFNKNAIDGFVKCQETGVLSTWTELVVDHRQPNTFSIIVDRFKEINRIRLEEVDYIINEDNFIVFQDNKLTTEFKQYHKEKASLRIVRGEVNSSRASMARIKRSSKDLMIK